MFLTEPSILKGFNYGKYTCLIMNLFSVVYAVKCLAVKFTKLCLVNSGDIISKNMHKQENLPAHLNKLHCK